MTSPRRGLVSLALLVSLGCDGSPAPATDAGTDSGPRRMRDAGTDAGPPPRTAFCDPALGAPGPYPEPGAFPAAHGPGLPATTFTESELGVICSYVDAGEVDTSDHHNLVSMYDGYMMMPFAPEWGVGGIAFFDLSDPCAPRVAGLGTSETTRETHSIGFSSHGGRWAAINQLGLAFAPGRNGIQFWDVSNPEAPEHVSDLELPGALYPKSYPRVVLSLFWQVPYVYVAGADNGIYIVDATDPTTPVFLSQLPIEPTLRAGQIQAIGNLLIVTAAEGARTVLYDISDPEDPQPIPGGDFSAVDRDGEPRDAYFTTASGGYIWYARKESGGGLIVMDIHDPTRPSFAGDFRSDGNGGYVFLHEQYALVGESRLARVYDISDLSDITVVRELDLSGDLDTVVPVGNLALLSVDDEAEPDRGSALAPWLAEPDTRGPRVTWAWPADGASGLAESSRFSVTFDEMIDVLSAWEGSVRLYRADAATPDEGRVAGVASVQETIVTFSPYCPLAPGDYVLEIPMGGVRDWSGNPITETFRATLTVGAP